VSGTTVPPSGSEPTERGEPAGRDPPVPARALERRVPREELDRIIRRAVELQFHAAEAAEGELSEAEVVRIGAEVGLDAGHVRRALEEVRADALAPALPPDASLLQRVIGPGHFQHRRVVPGEPERVEAELARWLRDRESLHPVRSRAGVSLWEPAEGFLPQLQRGLKWRGHRYDLAQARQVEVIVQGLEDGWSLVTLTLDLRNVRAEQGGGWMGGLAVGGAVAGVPLGLAALSLPPVGVVALAMLGAATGAAVGVPAGRKAFRDQAARIRLAAEGLLDRVERGDLVPIRPPRAQGD
jgi:hypothetical protein